jgi:hypothetical protein
MKLSTRKLALMSAVPMDSTFFRRQIIRMNPTMKTKRSQNLILAAAILVFALAGRSTSAATP